MEGTTLLRLIAADAATRVGFAGVPLACHFSLEASSTL